MSPASMIFLICACAPEATPTTAAGAPTATSPAVAPTRYEPGPTVRAQRAGFMTKLPPIRMPRDANPGPAPGGMYTPTSFPGPLGPLRAYITPDPGDGKRHPAILDLHSGFGGVNDTLWTYFDYGRPYREAGIVHFVPTRRGENDNAGEFEVFWGELDDAVASLRHLRSLPYVDPERIYVAGHSTGGTLALLLASETPDFRAAFSFEGTPVAGPWAQQFVDAGQLPRLPYDHEEYVLRSPIVFAGSLQRPTFYFYARDGGFDVAAKGYAAYAREIGTPHLQTIEVAHADHETVFYFLTDWLAGRIVADADVTAPFPAIDRAEVQVAFGSWYLRPDDGRDQRAAYMRAHPELFQ